MTPQEDLDESEELPLPISKVHELEELEIDQHIFYTRKS